MNALNQLLYKQGEITMMSICSHYQSYVGINRSRQYHNRRVLTNVIRVCR